AFIRRLEPGQDPASGRRVYALGCEQVLDPDRDSGERPELPARARLVRRLGGGKCVVRSLDRVGVERLRRSDGRVEALGDLHGAIFARAEAVAELSDGPGCELGHSMTFGTAKKPC